MLKTTGPFSGLAALTFKPLKLIKPFKPINSGEFVKFAIPKKGIKSNDQY
jgi:hypothetical protein